MKKWNPKSILVTLIQNNKINCNGIKMNVYHVKDQMSNNKVQYKINAVIYQKQQLN